MKHINVLDLNDEFDRNWCFSFGNLEIISNGASAQLFQPQMGNISNNDDPIWMLHINLKLWNYAGRLPFLILEYIL